jgi:hypothetical protein
MFENVFIKVIPTRLEKNLAGIINTDSTNLHELIRVN